jgi:hypothetical protein
MLHAPPTIMPLPPPFGAESDVIAFAVDLVVDRADAPRVAVRGGTVDVVNVVEQGIDDAGLRRVRFLVEADRGSAAFDVRVIVAVGGVEQSLAGPHVPART